ncbi:MAG: F-type H+-transporting ATPase subunit b [Parasphingorhabdus sp.]|jgi:F-type H+-transporting ATPase subunit b|uniref:F0F1 ATP synthase subunit B family protein n=1 Tax=Parasphingorhabdus sp. TaxID=2709688 RepID=UPI002B265704|nr:ATPase [Parasphingorhabdus sp.]|tara:strand:- start:1957 stop:2442 length:486 start_codon:yes stop_codon:yes gene_type:complete
MPQISQLLEVYGSQFFWLLIVIGIIYFGIAKNMVPKISKTVDDRQKRITDDLAAAQGAQDKAEQIETNYRASVNDARANAVSSVNEAKAKAALKNEAAIKRADAAIAKKADEADAELKAAKTAALKEIEAVAAEAAQAIVKTVSGAKVTAADAKKAVKAAF